MENYNPENQYRCTIIRGKSQTDMEDLLPYYANMVGKICPCTKEDFSARSNQMMSKALFNTSDYDSLQDSNKKTIRNHITEIAGTLLGLYYIEYDSSIGKDIVHETQSCHFLRENGDNTLFFKNLCLNFQFPNGEKSLEKISEDILNNIRLKPYCFVIDMLA